MDRNDTFRYPAHRYAEWEGWKMGVQQVAQQTLDEGHFVKTGVIRGEGFVCMNLGRVAMVIGGLPVVTQD